MKYIKYIGIIVIISIVSVLVIENNQLNKQIDQLEDKIVTVENQRNVLSDALRYSNDCYQDNNIINYTEYYLELINCNIDSLWVWSYCY